MQKFSINFKFLSQAFLVIFVILILFLKFYKVDARSLSLDELYSTVAALQPDNHVFFENWVSYDTNPPLYYIILRIWLKLVPATEVWIRSLSAIMVSIAIYFFITGIRKRFHKQEWFYLLLLMGCSYGFLFFAQEARAYGFLLFFTCMQILYFIDLLKIGNPSKYLKPLFYFTLFSILSSYTHYSGIVFSLILFFTLLLVEIKSRSKLWQIFAAILTCLIAGLFWLNNTIFLLNINKSFVTGQNLKIYKDIVLMLFYGNSVLGKSVTALALLSLPIIGYIGFKNYSGFRRAEKVILKMGLFSIGIIASSPTIPYFFSYRHYIVLFPLILLSLSIVIARKIRLSHKLKFFATLVCIILVVCQAQIHYKSKREEWRQAVNYIASTNKGNKSTVIIIGEPWTHSHKYYLQKSPGYLNLSIRRKAFYQYYFKRFDPDKNLELIVLRPEQDSLEKFITQKLLKQNDIFILCHAGDFSDGIEKLKYTINLKISKKDFYIHKVYHIVK